MPPSMFEDSYHRSQASESGENGYIQPNFNHGLRIWWAFFWPSAIASGVLVFLANAWIYFSYEHSYVSGSLLRHFRTVAPYILSYTVAFFVMYYILRKNFRHFRIGLLSNFGGEGAQPLVPTFRRTALIWFNYSWRTFVIRLIVGFAAAIPLGMLAGLFTRVPVIQLVVNLLVGVGVDGAAGLFVIYNSILDEDIGDFRVALLPRRIPEVGKKIVLPVQPVPPQPPVAI
jgi:hypothetical protein